MVLNRHMQAGSLVTKAFLPLLLDFWRFVTNKNKVRNCWRFHLLLFLLNCLLLLYMSYYCLCIISHPLHVSTLCCCVLFLMLSCWLWKTPYICINNKRKNLNHRVLWTFFFKGNFQNCEFCVYIKNKKLTPLRIVDLDLCLFGRCFQYI